MQPNPKDLKNEIMEHKKNIGDFLKNKLENAQKSPNDSLWERIDTSLDKKEKRRKRSFLLLFPGIALLVFLGFLIFQETVAPTINETDKFSIKEKKWELKENSNDELTVVENASEVKITENKTTDDTKEKISEEPYEIQENNVISKNKKTNTILAKNSRIEIVNSSETKSVSQTKSTKFSKVNSKENQIKTPAIDKEINIEKVERSSITQNDFKEKDNVKDSIAVGNVEKSQMNNENQSEKDALEFQKPNNPKWTVMAVGGPNLFRTSNTISTIDRHLDGYKTSGNVHFNYGLTIGFNATEKINISYGAIRTNLGYSIKNIPSSTSQDLYRILFYSALGDRHTNLDDFVLFAKNDDFLTLNQEIEYVELPLQLTYYVTDSRFGFHLFGGLSTYIMIDDTVYALNSNGEKLTLGEANNLSKLSFSLNAGVGAHYKLSKKFMLEVNPTFKYHFRLLDTPNRNTSGIGLGIFTGIKYNLNAN